MNKVTFLKALKAIGERKKVSCSCGGDPVVYQVVGDELTVNGKQYDIRDFCFSPTQILFGKWTIEDGDVK